MLLPPFSLFVEVHLLHSLPEVSSTHARCDDPTGRPHAPQPSVTGIMRTSGSAGSAGSPRSMGSTGMMGSSK